jgi:hypothetical protein
MGDNFAFLLYRRKDKEQREYDMKKKFQGI